MELSNLTLEQIDQILMEADELNGSLPDDLQFQSGTIKYHIKDILEYFIDELFDEIRKRESVAVNKGNSRQE